MIEVIDYGGGNIGSVLRCLSRLDVPYKTVGQNGEPPSGDAPLILPGVGAFGATMNRLRQLGLDEVIPRLTQSGVPFLGVCVGLQVLFDSSEETAELKGLGLISGQIVKYRCNKVPQIGWNAIYKPKDPQTPEGYVYFVNSYYAKPLDSSVVLYEAVYETSFCAAVQKNNITAFQFHPEKSGQFGHELLRRWVDAN